MLVAVTVKVAEPAAAGTVTEGGKVKAVVLLLSAMVIPLAGAAFVSMSEQVAEALEFRLTGLQESDDTVVAAPSPMVALTELEPATAVRVAVWSVDIVPVLAVNRAVLAPAFTVMEAGAVRALLVFVNVTSVPPAGAALVSVMVQLVEALELRLAGLQENEDTSAADTRLMAALVELVPVVAVMVAV
jgi:hypothetical protein